MRKSVEWRRGAPPWLRSNLTPSHVRAVEFYRTNGREKAIAELNRRDGAFATGMDYVDVHNLNGVCVAHPVSRDVVGQNWLDVTDMHGKRFIKEIINARRRTRMAG